MLEKIKNGADGAIDVGIKLISLSIVLQVIFGSKVAFLTGDVVSSILNIVWTKKVLENKSLTIFLGIVVVALFFGWVGG